MQGFITVILFCCATAQITTICRDGYILRNEYCYRLYQVAEDFSAANRSCVRDGASMVYIESAEEDEYLRATFFMGASEFWIGLNDMETEGVFRWLISNGSTNPLYINWAGGFPSANTNSLDCVKFSQDGWRVHEGYCTTSNLPHVCKLRSCQSADGFNCIGSEPASDGVAAEIIVIIVVIIIAIIVIVVVILVLLGLWKFNNDVFQRYICCCFFGGSKSAVHSMQQENQRLRRELSQHKISMSGRYQPGQLGELSGVPDGRGGVLPTIKRPVPGSGFSPVAEENRGLASPSNAPPPLRPSQLGSLNRQTSSTSASFFFGNPTTRPMRQSLPVRPSIPAPVRGENAKGIRGEEDDTGSDSNTSLEKVA